MLKRFSKYNKWKDFYDVNNSEVKVAILFTFFMCIIYFVFDIYNSFSVLCDSLRDFQLCIIGGYLGLLGFALSGIAIVISIFPKELHDLINIINGEEKLEKLMCSFEFLAFIIGTSIILNIFLYFSLAFEKELINASVFLGLYIFYCYSLVFNIFYTISLVGNCLKLYEIKNIYADIAKDKMSLEDANEIRIDYLIMKLVEGGLIQSTDFTSEVEEMIRKSNLKNKDEIINYYKKRYKL